MFATIDEILKDVLEGKMFILIDDELRENEGDIMVAAQYITPKIMNFITTYARGVMCMPIHTSIAEKLQLPLQHRYNVDISTPAFTVSICARRGITTGVSMTDRIRTIKVAIDPVSSHDDIKTPGHIYPVIAHPEGLSARQGHTEAAVEIMQLASITPAAILCEILKEDGEAACRDDVIRFGKIHNIKVSTIENLMQYKLTK